MVGAVWVRQMGWTMWKSIRWGLWSWCRAGWAAVMGVVDVVLAVWVVEVVLVVVPVLPAIGLPGMLLGLPPVRPGKR